MVVAKSQVILRVDPEFHSNLKAVAAIEGLTMTDYVIRAVNAWQAQHPSTLAPKALDARTALLRIAERAAELHPEPEGGEVDELAPGEIAQGDLAKQLGVSTTSLSNAKHKGYRGWRCTDKLLRRKGGRAQPIWIKD